MRSGLQIILWKLCLVFVLFSRTKTSFPELEFIVIKWKQPKKGKKKKAKYKEKKSWAIKITLKQLWSRSFLSLLPPWMGRRQLCEGQTGERSGEHARRFNISILQCCLFYGRESLFVRSVSGLDIHETYFWDFSCVWYFHVLTACEFFMTFFVFLVSFFLRRDLERVWFMVLIEASCFRKLCLHSGAFTLWRITSELFQVLV